jgi:hypothetical protein
MPSPPAATNVAACDRCGGPCRARRRRRPRLALRSLTSTTPAPSVPSRATRVAAAPVAAAAPAAKAEPPKVAAQPKAKEGAAQLADVDALRPEDLPTDLLEHPELFLRLPVVRRLEKLEYLGSEQERRGTDDGAG